jgi:hypothetical protein
VFGVVVKTSSGIVAHHCYEHPGAM